ncbi:hypothetical protein LTR28_001105, partial [Elasticomyces elasticus]
KRRRHLFPPTERTNHLPKRRSRRSHLSLRGRSAALSRSRQSNTTNLALYKLSWRLRDRRPRNLRHHDLHPLSRLHHLHRTGGLDGLASPLWRRARPALLPSPFEDN